MTVSVYRTVDGAVVSKYSIVSVCVPKLIPDGVLSIATLKSNVLAVGVRTAPVTAGASRVALLPAVTAVNAEIAEVFDVLVCVKVNDAPPVSWAVITPVEEPAVAVGPAIGPAVTLFGVESLASIVTDVVPTATFVPVLSVVISRSNVPSRLSFNCTPVVIGILNVVSASKPSDAPVVPVGRKSVSSIKAFAVEAAVLVLIATFVVFARAVTAVGSPTES